MNKRILGILICMLLIATVVPSVNAAENWTEEQKLSSSDSSSYWFGIALSISGDSALIKTAGPAFVYTRSGTDWTQEAMIKVPWTIQCVSIDGDIALLGEPTSGYYTG
jgi:hypothetical protein